MKCCKRFDRLIMNAPMRGIMTFITVMLLLHDLPMGRCNQTLPACVWRILPSLDVETGFIGVNTVFQVEYLDKLCSQEFQWSSSFGCSVQNRSLSGTSVVCHRPGYHTIIPTVNWSNCHCVPERKIITVRNNPLCYRWYAKSIDKVSVWSSGFSHGQWIAETLRVWVVDWTDVEEDRGVDNATIPSQSSADLTRKFYSKGQKPDLQQVHPTSQQQLNVQNSTFIQKDGYWEVLIQTPVYLELEFMIRGKPELAVQMCFIRDTSVILTDHWLSLPNDDESTVLRYTVGSPTRLLQDPCSPSVVILLADISLLLTLDGFQTSKSVSLPSHLLQGLSLDVESLAFTSTHLLLLIDSKIYAVYRTLDNLTEVTGLSGQFKVKGRDWCVPPNLQMSHMAVTFNSTNLFLIGTNSEDHQITLSEIKLPFSILQDLTLLDIEEIAFDSFSSTLGVVATATETSNSSLIFLLYDIILEAWKLLPFYLDVSNTYGSVSLMFVNSAHNGSFLFWDEKRICFTHSYGQTVKSFRVLGKETSMLNSSDSEVISQVCVSQKGDIVVLMSSNRLYYSRVGLTKLISIPAADLPTADPRMFFDSSDSLFIVTTANMSSGEASRWRYPLALELAGSLHSLENTCQYNHLEHGDTAGIYYLDRGDTVQLWTSLTFPAGSDVKLQVISSASSWLHIGESDYWDYHPGSLAVNKTLTVQSSDNLLEGVADYYEDLERFTGDAVVEVTPDQDDITCMRPSTMVARLSIGCPPGRHIRVRKPEFCQHFNNYTIPRDGYLEKDGTEAVNDKVVEYDWSAFGCPIPSHYQATFRPTLDLYDSDDKVIELSSNYVMYEEQGRTDYSYSATMLQAGCQSLAQTWSSMINGSHNMTSSSPLWGPHNYKSCFTVNVSTNAADLRTQSYQVLNNTGVSSIKWSTTRNTSIYQFTATVVDPKFSFCHLQTRFAVEVYGLPGAVVEKPFTQVSLGIFAILTLALGVVSYMYFRKGHIRKLEEQLFDYDADDK
ncbi:cation channel sperm-associated protein subunit epsilon-like [Asterias rubens]|uniref:cation channel sperm-associated protein subunit epsilon-like n=1 Tax=Asterias rubens TaxID=7604 RepID=UPI001455CDD8|nr:cation channel sperm-associated protein subunit epsilon-like [Asterias rubens]